MLFVYWCPVEPFSLILSMFQDQVQVAHCPDEVGGGGGGEAGEVSRYISQEGRKPWSIKGCTQGWLSLGIRLLQHRLTQSLERTPPGISWYTGICFVREEKERYAQGERGNFKAWSLRPWQRTHCCRHKCFPVCPRTQHLLRTQILCGTQKCFWFVQKHFVSASNVSQFAQPKKHRGQQCVRNNASSFARAFRIRCFVQGFSHSQLT